MSNFHVNRSEEAMYSGIEKVTMHQDASCNNFKHTNLANKGHFRNSVNHEKSPKYTNINSCDFRKRHGTSYHPRKKITPR